MSKNKSKTKVWRVYKLTNNRNGKIYIGTSGRRKVRTRLLQHFQDAYLIGRSRYDCYLSRAIRKYGKESFALIVLETCDSKSEMLSQEQFYIKKYNSNNPLIGYNLTEGGECGHAWSKEAKEKQSRRMKQRVKNGTYKCPNPGYKLSDEEQMAVCADYLSGQYIIDELVQKYEASKSAIYNVFVKHNTKAPKKYMISSKGAKIKRQKLQKRGPPKMNDSQAIKEYKRWKIGKQTLKDIQINYGYSSPSGPMATFTRLIKRGVIKK